jgi:hypothetical protein
MNNFRLRALLYTKAIDSLSFEFYLNNRGIVSPPKGTYSRYPVEEEKILPGSDIVSVTFSMYKTRKEIKLYSIVLASNRGKIVDLTEEGLAIKHHST